MVVSPLLALMKDQVSHLKMLGIEAEYLSSELDEYGRRVPGFQEAPGTRTHRGTAAVDGTDHAQSRKRFVGLHDAGAGDPVGLGKAAGGGKWVVIQETAIGDGSEDGRDHPLGDGVDLRVHDEMWVQLRCSPGHG